MALGLFNCDPATTSGAAGAAGAVGAAGTAGTAGDPVDPVVYDEVPLSLSEGRITSAQLGIEGTAYSESDVHSAPSVTSNLMQPIDPSLASACIRGATAKIDRASNECLTMMFTAPATDCFGEYWGVAIRMNLQQPIDPNTGEGAATPLPFDASALEGFAFDLAGPALPPSLALSFEVDSDVNATPGEGQYCSQGQVKLVMGTNRVRFSQLLNRCFRRGDPPNPSAETAQSKLIRMSWHVLTNTEAAVPFDFCVSNVRALLK
jgi:hypothetical protein